MKKGINIWSFKAGTSVKDCIAIAKQAGFEGIELGLNESGEVSLNTAEQELLEIKKYADEVQIDIASVATGLYWSYSLTSEDRNVREKAKDIVKKQLDTAAILGANNILIVPGAVGVDFILGSKVVSYDKAYDLSLEALNELKSEAEALKVSIGLENVWNKFLLSPLEMRDFIDKVGSSFVGSYLDIGNIIYSGYPEQWIRILGKRIKKVHFKDFRRSVGTLSGFVDLLAGDVDYPEVMKAFDEIGYNDYAFAEMIPNYTHYTNQIIFNTSNSMDKIFRR
ncbi:MAG TPA: sugar phosphate isomerase/epimerase family protein [Clostridia bacterium]|nr:sugar phosphate isomerase/epimerase family protein [Clostridia bacterium]